MKISFGSKVQLIVAVNLMSDYLGLATYFCCRLSFVIPPLQIYHHQSFEQQLN